MISIIIPTFNNLNYLKICINSLEKNSKHKHEIKLHVNEGLDGTKQFADKENIPYTHSNTNIGLCSAINKAAKDITNDYILYAHDDMYFCPGWDTALLKEIQNMQTDLFYLSGTMIEPKSAHISFNCGSTHNDFDEQKLLSNYKDLSFYDHQGSHFAPHLIKKKLWDQVGGFSEEFNPGMASDPDFNMKLWNHGVRIFKGINDFRVYHFSSVTTRKKNNLQKNKGDITFIQKWGFSHKFFKKHYLRSNSVYNGPLNNPKKQTTYYVDLFFSKLKFFYLNFFFKF